MHVRDLIREFSEREALPVDVNDILACLRSNGHDDDVEFIGVDLDPDVLQGMIKVFHYRPGVYADPIRAVNIYYHRGHSLDWQRMICAKELVHTVDPSDAYTATPEAIDYLAEKVGLPPELQDPTADGFETNVDRLAEFRALALLFPKAARDILKEPYRSGNLTTLDIARMADIPSRYISFVMGDTWDGIHELLI